MRARDMKSWKKRDGRFSIGRDKEDIQTKEERKTITVFVNGFGFRPGACLKKVFSMAEEKRQWPSHPRQEETLWEELCEAKRRIAELEKELAEARNDLPGRSRVAAEGVEAAETRRVGWD
jgi:hypothetical protein